MPVNRNEQMICAGFNCGGTLSRIHPDYKLCRCIKCKGLQSIDDTPVEDNEEPGYYDDDNDGADICPVCDGVGDVEGPLSECPNCGGSGYL